MKTYKHNFIIISIVIVISLIILSCTDKNEQTSALKNGVHVQQEKQLWTCGMHPEVVLDEPGQCPKCGMDLVPLKQTGLHTETSIDTSSNKNEKGRILYWQAPMNPEEIYDAPGKSKMGMDLVPVYENQVSSGSTIIIDPVTVQNMGVRTSVVKRTDFSRKIRVPGNIAYDEKRTYIVSPRISGWIEKLNVDFTGKTVFRGQTLLEIYSPDLVTTQQEYLLAVKNNRLVTNTTFPQIRRSAETLLEASRQRLLNWGISSSEIDLLEHRGTISKTLKLRSPANGIVTNKQAVDGAYVKEGMMLYEIVDISRVWIYASVYDSDLPWIRTGQKAEVVLSYLPGEKFYGKITYIYPVLNEKTRDVKVRIELSNPDNKLKPGMYADVYLQTEVMKNVLVIPAESVIRTGQRNIVFVSKGNGRFQPRNVVIGEENSEGDLRIIQGLAAGEKVVNSAQFLLDSESRLQEAIQKMLADKRKPSKSDNLYQIKPQKDIKQMDHYPNSTDNDTSKMKCGSGKCGGAK